MKIEIVGNEVNLLATKCYVLSSANLFMALALTGRATCEITAGLSVVPG